MSPSKAPPVSAWLPHAVRYAQDWLGFQMALTEQPGCVLAVAQDGAIVAERAFGLADIASAEPLTPAHRFRVASHSKTFTAAAILKLHEAGRLHLDDPVGAHVDGLPLETAAVTLAQLLSHSAGLVRDGERAGHWQDKQPFLARDALMRELAAAPTLPSNTRFKYSNIGFGLAGLVIERLAGESYDAFVERELLAPLGLSATTPDMPPTADAPFATGHTGRQPAGRRLAIPGRNPTHALGPATGFVSTAADMARWIGSLDPQAKASALSVASRREMTRRHWAIPEDSQGRHYGLGIIGGALDGRAWFGHSGAFQGFISRTATLPDWGVTVSIVTNGIDGLANPWVDGVIGVFNRFAALGPPEGEAADWTGRWWTYWGAFDLVPMGRTVLVATPGQMQPFADASELEVETATKARIRLANGFGSHGEPATREFAADGTPAILRLGGAELSREAALVSELEAAARAAGHLPGDAS